MQKRIDRLQPGAQVTLRFHGSMGNETHDERATFQGIVGEGDDRLAQFDGWEAYRYRGHWAYGTSADRLSLISVESA